MRTDASTEPAVGRDGGAWRAVQGSDDGGDASRAPLADSLGPRLGPALTFATTEHFNLQTARSLTVSEANGRASIYLAALSGNLIALAFVGQMSRLGATFDAFAPAPACDSDRHAAGAHRRSRCAPAKRASACAVPTSGPRPRRASLAPPRRRLLPWDSHTFASEGASGGMRLERPGVRSISPSSAGSALRAIRSWARRRRGRRAASPPRRSRPRAVWSSVAWAISPFSIASSTVKR
jgi:hypothetical protein